MAIARLIRGLSVLAVSSIASAVSFGGCEIYDSPPRPSLDGLVDGVLPDRTAPVVLRFSEPIDRETFTGRIVLYETDEEGNLLPDTEEFFAYEPATANLFGQAAFSDDDRTITITVGKPMPIGSNIALVIDANLTNKDGTKHNVPLILLFTFRLSCDDAGGTDAFPSGTYFFLANVANPLPVQVQLWGQIIVDPATGKFIGQFTNADRNPDPGRCSPPCDASEACRLLPAEDCVLPSLEAATEDEFSDFVANVPPPTGYSFRVEGCLSESESGVAFVNLPADVVIQQPAVTIEGIQLTASFRDEDGRFRGTGGVTADGVIIGTTPSGPATGSVLARLVPPDQVPPGIPGPEL